MLPEEAAQLLASCEEVHVGSMEDLEAFLLQCKVDVDPSQSDTQPKQDQASGSQQEAGAQSANGQSADPPKPAGGNGKKKKNRKKGGPKAPQEEQLTGRGIMESDPVPEGPPAGQVPQPPPSLIEPSDDAPASDAATVGSAPESEHSLRPAQPGSQPEPETDSPAEAEPEEAPEALEEPEEAKGVPVDQPQKFSKPTISLATLEQLKGLHLSGRADSEEEVYHDAGSGIESPAQLGSLGSRRSSLDSNPWPQFSSAGKRARLAYIMTILLHTIEATRRLNVACLDCFSETAGVLSDFLAALSLQMCWVSPICQSGVAQGSCL